MTTQDQRLAPFLRRAGETPVALRPEYAEVPHGCLPVGTVTPLGTIEAVALTAYRIAGEWHAFQWVHGPHQPATPLVTLTGAV